MDLGAHRECRGTRQRQVDGAGLAPHAAGLLNGTLSPTWTYLCPEAARMRAWFLVDMQVCVYLSIYLYVYTHAFVNLFVYL